MYGIIVCMKYTDTKETKKVTMNLPVDLAENAAEYLGKSNLTEAVRFALREAMHQQACRELLEMQGKVDLQIDIENLRAMDDE